MKTKTVAHSIYSGENKYLIHCRSRGLHHSASCATRDSGFSPGSVAAGRDQEVCGDCIAALAVPPKTLGSAQALSQPAATGRSVGTSS
jgi:hypothetical protein